MVENIIDDEVLLQAQIIEERFRTTVELEEPDCVPSMPHFGSGYLSYMMGASRGKWQRSSKLILDSQLKIVRRYPSLLVYPGIRPHMGTVAETSALGCKIKWPERGAPFPRPMIRKLRDLQKLEVPDPHRDGLLPMFLNHYRYILKRTGDRYPMYNAATLGPIEIASFLRGITQLMGDLYLNPEWVHELLELTTETSIAWLRAQNEIIDEIKVFWISEDVAGLLSPRHYKEFALPYEKRVFKTLPNECIGIYHNGSNTSHILRMIPETGAKITYIGEEVDIEKAKQEIGGKICLYGNLSPSGVLLRGTPEEVEEESKRCIRSAGPGGGYILGGGESLSDGTPLENIDAMMQATKMYGKYPISDQRKIRSHNF